MKDITKPSIQVMTFEELLNKDGAIVYTNVGASMMPLLRERKDLIEIRRKGEECCRKYDVVLYKRGEQYILHRILKVFPNKYILAGDHNTFIDPPVTDEMILGVMTRVIRDGKSITPDNIWYKAYVHLWCDFFPIRVLLLKTRFLAYRYLNAIKRRVLG